jgi:hypothetical protein
VNFGSLQPIQNPTKIFSLRSILTFLLELDSVGFEFWILTADPKSNSSQRVLTFERGISYDSDEPLLIHVIIFERELLVVQSIESDL